MQVVDRCRERPASLQRRSDKLNQIVIVIALLGLGLQCFSSIVSECHKPVERWRESSVKKLEWLLQNMGDNVDQEANVVRKTCSTSQALSQYTF